MASAAQHAPSELVARRFGVCLDCSTRPEVRRLDPAPSSSRRSPRCRLCSCLLDADSVGGAPAEPAPRSFTAPDKALIRKMAAHLPSKQLLDLLNERLVADLGPDAARYTEAMLADEMRHLPAPETVASGDWGGLRRVLAAARRSGVLASITEQMIDDFAIVFSLSPAQALRLRDTIQSAQDQATGESA